MPTINFNFISNNIEGLKLTKNWIKLFEYFKSKLTPRGVLFAQTTHSTKAIEQKCKDKLNALIFHLHGNSSSCGFYSFFWQ